MASIHDRFQVPTDPAVITPFEDVDDPLAGCDVPVASIERDDYYIFGPPSQSSDGRYTTRTRSSIGGDGRGRRFSNHTQLTEPSSISDMPSDCFPLEKQKRIAKPMPTTTTAMAMAMPRTSSPAISPTTHRDITAYRTGVPDGVASPSTKTRSSHHHHSSHHSSHRPRPRRHHTSTAIDTPTRFHPEPYSPHRSSAHLSTPVSRSHSSVRSSSRAPLILLHVTLLPSPQLPYAPHILRRVLPRSAMRAFAQLEERLADPVLMTRGLLVAHPREEMDLLEERVLEGLELRAPRVLKCGHFYHHADEEDEEGGDGEGAEGKGKRQQHQRRDSGVEAEVEEAAAEEQNDDDEHHDDEEEITCDECHAHLPLPPANTSARWTIKIYAANGLLAGPGAWSAAWSEMERVDVAISPYLSPAQHRALQRAVRDEEQERSDAARRADDERAALIRAAEDAGREQAQIEANARVEELREEAEQRVQEKELDRLRLIGNAALAAAAERRAADERVREAAEQAVRDERRRVREERARRLAEAEKARMEVPLAVLVRRALWVVLVDWRNALILMLVAWLCMGPGMVADVPQSTDLELSGVFFDAAAVSPMFFENNATVEQQQQQIDDVVLRATETVTATATHTSTAIVTAFILETLAPQAIIAASAPLDQSASTTADLLSQPTDTPDAIDEQYKDAVFAATTEILASAFEKMDAIISALVDAYEKTTGDEDAAMPAEHSDASDAVVALIEDDGSIETELPYADVCSGQLSALAYPTCAVDGEEEAADAEDVEQKADEDPRPRTCANRELDVEYFSSVPTCSVHLIWV